MPSSKPKTTRWPLWLSLPIWALSQGCVTVPDIHTCAALPFLSIGAGCTHTLSGLQERLSTSEILDLIDSQPFDRHCVPAGQVIDPKTGTVIDQGVQACADDQSHGAVALLPARGPSIIIPPDDWSRFNEALQEICREAGSSCSYQSVKQ